MRELVKSQVVLDCMKRIDSVAKNNGHLLGNWQWGGRGYWRTDCQKKDCFASVWVARDGSCNIGEVKRKCYYLIN